MSTKKQAVVLSGGGARGGYQAGTLEFLRANNKIDPDLILGTSSGALNAIGVSYLGYTGNSLQWSKIKHLSDLFKPNWISWIWKTGVLNPAPAFKIITDAITTMSPSMPVILTNINIETGEKIYIDSSKVPRETFIVAAKSAVSIPAVVECTTGFVDGGARELAPIGKAIDEGASEIVVILDRPLEQNAPWVNRLFPNKKYFQPIEIGWRYVDLMLNQILLNDLGKAARCNQLDHKRRVSLKLYYPKDELYDTFSFDKCKDGVDLGRLGVNLVLATDSELRSL